MNIKAKSFMKYLRESIDQHDKDASDQTISPSTRATMWYTAQMLRNVRSVAAECIKSGEWLESVTKGAK